MLTRRAMASSGSMLGSTPPKSAKAFAPPPPAPTEPKSPPAPAAAEIAADAAKADPPPDPWMTGDEARTSLGRTPAGMVTRWQDRSSPSFRPLAAFTSSFSFSSLASSSPIATTSIEMLFFFSCRPTLLRAFASMPSRGDPMNRTMRWAPFLFLRCFSASEATWMAAVTSALSFFPFFPPPEEEEVAIAAAGPIPKDAPFRLISSS
mmetsp:Transcript_27605/g.64812  ORF Transcript_27605/g.64812 Transcript_27605/m.64812 type:complete len:206 (-) Transcript_27605:470-1087(-)